jgi:hypothetical protein
MPQDRADFRAAMLAARKALLKANPRLATVSN